MSKNRINLLYSIIFTIFLINGTYAKPVDEEQAMNEAGVYDSSTDTNDVAENVETTDKSTTTSVIDSSNENDFNNVKVNVNENENSNKIFSDETNEARVYRKEYAQRMLRSMNRSVSPCDDFYEYACGNWKNTLIERQSPHKRDNLLDIRFELHDMIEGLLLEPADNLKIKYVKELKKARTFYRSCLNADLRPFPKSSVYLDLIKSIGGFPAIETSWNAKNFSWFNMTAHLTNYGVDGLINDDILPQYPFQPYFKLPDLGFDLIVHSDNIASNTTHGYKLNEKRMREYLTTYGVVEPKISEVIESVFELWYAILKVSDEFREDLDICKELSLSENITEWSEWKNYYEIAWNDVQFDNEHMDDPCNYYYEKLDDICKERKEAVANYLAMKFLYKMDARLEHENFKKEFCNSKVKNSLTYLIDQLYLEKYFRPEIRSEVSLMTRQVQKIFRETLETSDWLDEHTREEAILKINSITSRVGKFENKELTDRLTRAMENFAFDGSNYEQNNLEITKFRQYIKRFNGFHHKELGNDTKPLDLLIGMQVNAFYYNIDNSINVMAGILNPPAYHRYWPFSLKFGTLGYLIGHELTHGFDTVGAMYDSEGDSRYWWTEKSGKVFTERANCYANKFDSYVVPEIKRNINGNITKDENIADNGGLRNALSAYHRYIKTLSIENYETETSILKDEMMPGLDLTPDQIFFLGFAQLWCADYKEEHYWEEIKDEHAIDKYRVLGTVSNMADFAEVYNCPLGSKMNPSAERCELW